MGKKYSRIEMWCILVNNGVATDEEINLVTCINGYTEKTLLDILYARTGYRTIDQLLEERKDV